MREVVMIGCASPAWQTPACVPVLSGVRDWLSSLCACRSGLLSRNARPPPIALMRLVRPCAWRPEGDKMKITGFLVMTALAAGVSGCAARVVPDQFPEQSASSAFAEEAPRADITVSLREDPPLPGEDTSRWPGLKQEEPEDHEHHGHHGGDGAASPHQHDTSGGGADDKAVRYVCPMHPRETSDHEGRCSICGMKLEPQP
ncbi:MAG: hypothetical protein GMKNLPBB_02170 [Myxococcota bacterium]|nr:hypothetical protein [Myxococcota bacterium]